MEDKTKVIGVEVEGKLEGLEALMTIMAVLVKEIKGGRKDHFCHLYLIFVKLYRKMRIGY